MGDMWPLGMGLYELLALQRPSSTATPLQHLALRARSPLVRALAAGPEGGAADGAAHPPCVATSRTQRAVSVKSGKAVEKLGKGGKHNTSDSATRR